MALWKASLKKDGRGMIIEAPEWFAARAVAMRELGCEALEVTVLFWAESPPPRAPKPKPRRKAK